MSSSPLAQLYYEISHKLVRTDSELIEIINSNAGVRIQTVNLHHIYLATKDQTFRDGISQADYVTADGWPVAFVYGNLSPAVERCTGADLVHQLVSGDQIDAKRIALIGASPESGSKFGEMLRLNNKELVFSEHGSVEEWSQIQLAARVTHAQADLVLVAVTPPSGENFAAALASTFDECNVIAVGGAIDMTVGQTPRAPQIFQKFGLEWMFRLGLEPRRMYRRYVLQCGPVFIQTLLLLRKVRRRVSSNVDEVRIAE